MHEIKRECEFDYSLVSDYIVESLKSKANQLNGIYFRYTNEVGKVLFEAQQELADYNNGGVFAQWVESMGIKRQRAYEYINIYKYAVRITDNEKLEIFNTQPKSIKNEMSKPSAIPEVNEAVFKGNVKSHDEYKKMEQALKKQLKQKDEIINELSNQEPQTVTKVVEKEVFPNDYHEIKSKVSQLQITNQRLIEEHQKLLREQEEVNEKSIKYDELNEAIQASQGQLNQTQKKISEYNDLHKLLKESNSFLSKASALVYSDLSSLAQSDPLVQQELNQLLNNLNRFTRDINELLSQKIILEGEIIND
ncbi:hypothetical protein ACQV2W_00695 [Facklamia sp. P12934]|uniref:hypothetical protein n=1 Tax=Facklamia sp. P12934 TaxID=3421948 RepID=UPI003D186954